MHVLGVFLVSILPLLSSVIAQEDANHYYPQPPLPSTWAVNDPSAWTLSPDFEITNVPTTREYFWNVTAAAAAPDGYPRQIYAVNNQMPGPLVEANEGDTIIVHFTNLIDTPMTIHWHGIYQNGSQWMDGVPGISQCPIASGETFTYRFTVDGQYGTYWWHSHFSNHLADGIAGALIIHSVNDPLVRGVDFDHEMVVFISDWMDIRSDDIVHGLHTKTGYRNTFAPPQGNAILVNGVGRTNCSNEDIQDHTRECNPPLPPELRVPAGKRIKFRMINTSSHGHFRVSIDNHPFDVVEVDDTAVWGPTGIHEIGFGEGERTAIVFTTDQGKPGDAWYFRANILTACLGPGAIPQTGLAVLRYVDEHGESPSDEAPDTQAWDDLQGQAAKCIDIDEEYYLVPREPKDAPTEILQTHALSSQLGNFLDNDGNRIGGFGFNNITYQNQIGYPLLAQLEDGAQLDDHYVAHAVYDQLGGADLIVNNLDGPISHPYHLHGKPFFLVARGKGNLTAEQWEGMRYGVNTKNPLRRDTLQIPGGSYAVLRLVTDLPGVWPLHCHIGWHLAEGKLAALVVQPETIKGFKRPDDWTGLCNAFGHDDLGPARRDLSSRNSAFEDDLAKERRAEGLGVFRKIRKQMVRRGEKDQ